MTPFHLRESHERIVALCLALVDPTAAILVALWLTVKLRPVVESLLQHQSWHYYAWAAILFSGIALVAANPMVPCSLLARGIGFQNQAFKETKPRHFVFWIGIALIAISHNALAVHWIEQHDPIPDYTGTAVLAIIDAFALSYGIYNLAVAAWRASAATVTDSRIQLRNRSRFRNLAGQLALCGGMANGVFRERNLANGAPEQGEALIYGERSANRGTLAVGAPGSSKTRSKIYPDFYWGLRTSPRAGALVFVTKRRATNDFIAIASKFRSKNQIHVVGVGRCRSTIDITAGMTHESIGDAIKDGLGESHSEFWKQGPSAFVEGFVELIHALRPAKIRVAAATDKDGHVEPGGEAYDLELGDTLPTLLSLMSLDGRRLEAVFGHGFDRAKSLDHERPAKAAELRALLYEIKDRIVPLLRHDAKLGEELRQSALPQLQPFGRGSIRGAFCDRNGIDLSLLEKGHVIIIEIDETEHPRAVGTIVRMIFRRIVQMARERTASNRVGHLDPILLICDEYTNYAAAGHVQVWNTVRESNFCATIGITSMSALTEQLGKPHAATSIVGNFANKFFFESDDKATRDLANELIGKTTVTRRSTSAGRSRTRGTSASSSVTGGGSHQSSGTTRSESTSEHIEDALDGSIWRKLRAEKEYAIAIAFIRTDEGTTTDVVTLGVLDPANDLATATPAQYGLA
ncbi:MAG: TraM recognition domain-containing protein [Candidatus Tyrphobacter sp.]